MPVIKWYLNLPPRYGDTGKNRSGTEIKLIAKRSRSDSRGPQAVRQVNWAVTEAGPHNADRDYFDLHATLAAPSTRERNGEFHNTLKINTLGGRAFTITATKA